MRASGSCANASLSAPESDVVPSLSRYFGAWPGDAIPQVTDNV